MTFAGWLRTQMRARRLSQRGLARRSGIHHATISRLLRGERVPSLRTATRLARALRAIEHDGHILPLSGAIHRDPIGRIEHALRLDPALGPRDVREVMRLYLAVRSMAVKPTIRTIDDTDEGVA